MLVLLFLAIIPLSWGCAPAGTPWSRTMKLYIGNIDPNTKAVLAYEDRDRLGVHENMRRLLTSALHEIILKYESRFIGITTVDDVLEASSIEIESIDNMITCRLGIITTNSPFSCPGAHSREESCCVSPPSQTNWINGICEFEQCTDQTFYHPTERVRVNFIFRGRDLRNKLFFVSPEYAIQQIGEATFLNEFKNAVKLAGWGGPGFDKITVGRG